MPRFDIHHITKYTYAEPVKESANRIMLYPISDEYQDVTEHNISITGEPSVEKYTDYYGNETGSFMNVDLHTELRIDSTLTVVTKLKPLPTAKENSPEQWNSLLQLKYTAPFIDFLSQEYFTSIEEIKAVANIDTYKKMSVFDAANSLNEYVYKNFQYIKGITTVETTVDEIWKLKAGVCQDFAHILLVMLRLIDIPARYVSGYVCPKNNDLRGEGATHAWVEAYIPAYGWIGFDPTNNCVANDLHVRLAVGRNFNDCSPVKGTYKGTAKQTLEVGVSVTVDGEAKDNNIPTLTTEYKASNNEEKNGVPKNSYRRHMEMMMQQQQQ